MIKGLVIPCVVPDGLHHFSYNDVVSAGVATQFLVVKGRARSFRCCIYCSLIEYWDGEECDYQEQNLEGEFVELRLGDEYSFIPADIYRTMCKREIDLGQGFGEECIVLGAIDGCRSIDGV